VQRGFVGIRLKRGPTAPGDTLGVRVDEVISGSPAAVAGIREGDHILAMDGQEVRSAEDLVSMVSALRPGYDAEVTILRDAEIIPLRVVVGSNLSGPRQQGAPRSEASPARTPADRKAMQEHLSKLREEQRALEERLKGLESDSTSGDRR
jgi:predicted metalloprotease with PDZ domain